MKFQIVLSALIFTPFAVALQSSKNPVSSRKVHRTSWIPNHLRSNRPVNPFRRDSYTDASATDATTGKDMTEDAKGSGDDDKGIKHVPQINFYSSVPNGIGVIGQGLIWLREVSAALGTVIQLMSLPLPLWIFAIPMALLGTALMFLPDLTTLSLPGFYPNGGGDSDPLSAFPPLFGIEGLMDLDFVQKATQLLPPKLLSMKRG